MLARNYRLTKKDGVEEIMTQGRILRSRLIVMRFLPNKLPNNRYMALVSNKMANRAPDRNRLRRQIYEIIRLEEKRKEENSRASRGYSLDMVIFPKKAIIKTPFKEIQRQLLSLINSSNQSLKHP